MDHSSGHDEVTERVATASYIASISGELAGVARERGLGSLAYLLEMARLEAEAQMRRLDPPS